MNTLSIITLACAVVFAAAAAVLFLRYRNIRVNVSSLETEKGNYENIIRQANDAMLVIDIVDGRIYQANEKLAEMLGYTRDRILALTVFDLHPKNMLEKSSEVIADVWEKKGLIYQDIPFVTSSGDLLPVECSAKVAPFAGRPSIVIYARDIRERLRMEGEIKHQNEIIEQKNKDITDSINYAKRIQQAILSSKDELKKYFPDSFVFLKAKDIVSGDFFWLREVDDAVFIAAVDCTGHGVPGAFMSMIGNSLLSPIVRVNKVTRPSEALNRLRDDIIRNLKQTGAEGETKDGMDISLVNINRKTNLLQFAGAFNPLWLIRDRQLTEIDGDKFPIGTYVGREGRPFTNHEIQLKKGDCIYLFTDGYADQFGGPKGKKFKYRQLTDLLLSVQDNTMDEQKKVLYYTLENWRGGLAQVDDILVIGIRI